MRLVLAVHRFPPEHRAGTELYTERLALALRERGHEPTIVSAAKEISAPDGVLREREWRGLRVLEITNNLLHERFSETYDDPRRAAPFAAALERAQPQLLHVQHLMYLGLGCLRASEARGVPALVTLHDYWAQCARLGQRLHADGSVCARIDHARCGGCLTDFKWRQSPVQAAVGRGLALLRRGTGLDLGGAAVRAGRRHSPTPPRDPAQTTRIESTPAARALAQESERRERAFRDALLAGVRTFVSPSAFLRERFIEWGIPAGRIVHLPTAPPEAAPAPRPARREGAPLEVLFLGSLVPAKGAHVLLEAWSRLAPGARARLALCGPAFDGAYAARLERHAAELGVEYGGALEPAEAQARLARADVLCVPSLWYENAPLVVLEAARAGTCVLASDLGALRELVREGMNGERFPAGDAGALADRLRRWIEHPDELARYAPRALPLPSLAEWIDAHERLYAATLAGSAS